MSKREAIFSKLSNAALRQIVEDDAKLCDEIQCWKTLEGYYARLILGRRRTWGFYDRFEDGKMSADRD